MPDSASDTPSDTPSDDPLPLDEVTRRLRDHVRSLARPAWQPHTEAIADTSDAALRTASHFCGPPYIPVGTEWPLCECGQPLQLFLQLNLDELPDEAKRQPGLGGSGLLQVFYHHVPADQPGGGECYAEPAWEAFDESHKTVRVVRPDGESESTNRNNESDLEPARIVGWKSLDDVPVSDEAGIDFDYGRGTMQVSCDAIGLSRRLTDDDVVDGIPYLDYLFDDDDDDDGDDGDGDEAADAAGAASPLGGPRSRDKLGGWPKWVQDPDYPDCPDCGEPMTAVFQIDSEDHVDYMFGDCGTAHVFCCRTHPEIVTLSWGGS